MPSNARATPSWRRRSAARSPSPRDARRRWRPEARMALQGNLRDFAATEILQLVGTQKKSGCLSLEWNTEKAVVWVQEGRIVSTRVPGMSKDDPLLNFLRKIHRLSDEQ